MAHWILRREFLVLVQLAQADASNYSPTYPSYSPSSSTSQRQPPSSSLHSSSLVSFDRTTRTRLRCDKEKDPTLLYRVRSKMDDDSSSSSPSCPSLFDLSSSDSPRYVSLPSLGRLILTIPTEKWIRTNDRSTPHRDHCPRPSTRLATLRRSIFQWNEYHSSNPPSHHLRSSHRFQPKFKPPPYPFVRLLPSLSSPQTDKLRTG